MKRLAVSMFVIGMLIFQTACGGSDVREEAAEAVVESIENTAETETDIGEEARAAENAETEEVDVAEQLPIETDTGAEADTEDMIMKITAGETTFTATLAENSSAEALKELLAEGPLTINMSDYASMEKVGPIGTSLPRNDEQIDTGAGDIILYQGNSLVIYYGTNSWNFTRIGKIQDVTKEELLEAFGDGDVTVTFSLESETPVQEENGTKEDADEEAKALVVYFSATGNTKAVAETLAGLQDADLYEIVPGQPYTDEDLNYRDHDTRATLEQNDPDARPAIQGSIPDFEQYEVVYVGYPIWWSDMPRILYTFFDTYDFSGKTIAPFCTSGGSGLSGTPGTIAELEAGAVVLDGLHISGSSAGSAENSVSEWLGSIGLAK